MKKITKIKNKWIFILIQGVQGATREGPEPIPELKNTKNDIFSFFAEPARAGRAGPGRTDIGPSPGMNEHPIRAIKMIFTSIDTPFNFLQFEMVKPSK